jgi:hypothetical protein
LLLKATKLDNSISNEDELFFRFILELAKASALGLGYILLTAFTIRVPLGARLWQINLFVK